MALKYGVMACRAFTEECMREGIYDSFSDTSAACYVLVHWTFRIFVPLVDTDSVICTTIYFVTVLFLTQLPHDRKVRET